jgi:hypothetical protein
MKYMLILFLFSSHAEKVDSLTVKFESKIECVSAIPDYISKTGDLYMGSICVPDGLSARHNRGDTKIRN